MVKAFSFGLTILFSNYLFASQEFSNNRFHEMTKIGQAADFDFAYSTDPLIQSKEKVLVPYAWESGGFEQHISNMIISQAEELNIWWESQLSDQLLCPNHALSKNLDYIQYLYRLVSLSYLFESLTDHHNYLSKLGLAEKECSLEWEDLFSKCNPKGEEMKKFTIRLKGRHLLGLDSRDYALLGPSDQEQLMKELAESAFSKKSSGLMPTQMRLNAHCAANICPKPFDKKWLKSTVTSFCKSDKQLLQLICSENDQLYGISKIPEARLLVEHSNAMTIIRQSGYGSSCLSRFTKLFSKEEKEYKSLDTVFQSVWSKMTSVDSRYLQGNAFVLGSLKEFDDKGLTDILVAREAPVAKKEEVAVAAPIVEKVVASAPVQVVEVEEKKPELVKAPVVKKNSKIQFELAVDEREKAKLDKVAVNMELMQADFLFSPKMLSVLSGPMRQYQTRKALEEMKRFDHLGTQKEPVRLIFLKFLIDHDFHQGLYNLTSVLGEKFWVLNDISGIEEPRFIELKNDESTNNRWQIYLVKPPESLDSAVNELKAKLKS